MEPATFPDWIATFASFTIIGSMTTIVGSFRMQMWGLAIAFAACAAIAFALLFLPDGGAREHSWFWFLDRDVLGEIAIRLLGAIGRVTTAIGL